MKRITVMILCLLLVAAGAVSVCGAVLSPALDVIAKEYSMTISAIKGETVDFTDSQFYDAAGTDLFEAVKIVSLPDEKDGILYLNDVPAMIDQVVLLSDVGTFKFVPGEDTEKASFRFSVDDLYTMTCTILFDNKNNGKPTAKNGISVKTYASTVCAGKMAAVDPDNDNLRFEVVKFPEKGTLVYEKGTGVFRYTPSNASGEESFIYRAVDSRGAYSAPASVDISIMNNDKGTLFADMENNTAATAAIAMTDSGVMSFSEDDGKKVFSPDSEVSRLEFLISAMNLFGASNIPTVTDSGFADDGDIPDEYKGVVYSARKLGIINGIRDDDKLCFCPNRPITPEEASVLLNNVIGYVPENSVDAGASWSSEAVSAMKELGVYYNSDDDKSVSRANAAQMLFGLSCLLYE